MKKLRMLLGVLALGVARASADAGGGDPLTLEQALAAARADNPRLRAARLQRQVAAADVDAANEWPNPEARYERERETPREAFALSQPLPWPGKRSARIAAANAAARSGEAELV